MQKQYSLEIGAETLVFETGKIAKQANGAVRAQYGDTIVLTTACIAGLMIANTLPTQDGLGKGLKFLRIRK